MKKKTKTKKVIKTKSKTIRYAVVGLGHIAQAAVLPAFKHAENAELVALVSNDEEKLTTLGKQYKIDEAGLLNYNDYPHALHELQVDAVYIAVPNHLHLEFALQALEEGFHVLCEKPLTLTSRESNQLIHAAEKANVKFMTAYRLHFEAANLDVIKHIHDEQKIGDIRLFNSVFTMQVEDENNIRLNPTRMGGGPLWDIGIYCINAARGIFRDEPIEVVAMAENNGEPRFSDIDEMISVSMRFPQNRLANFIISFGADSCASYDVIGTKGRLHLENAYEYAEKRELKLYEDEKPTSKTYAKNDQFAPELIYFSNCILQDEEPETSAYEGKADVKVIMAILQSLDSNRPIRLNQDNIELRYPDPSQLIQRPGISKPKTVNVVSATGD